MQITAFKVILARRINILGCEDYENTFTILLQSSAIAKHYKNVHGTIPQGLLKRFEVLKKCRNQFDCLV